VDTTTIREPASKVPTPSDETPHGCYEGLVYMGYEEDGEEVIETVPCRRCSRVAGEDLQAPVGRY
jgi:hypothetical protein